jgi:hypothetical protein
MGIVDKLRGTLAPDAVAAAKRGLEKAQSALLRAENRLVEARAEGHAARTAVTDAKVAQLLDLESTEETLPAGFPQISADSLSGRAFIADRDMEIAALERAIPLLRAKVKEAFTALRIAEADALQPEIDSQRRDYDAYVVERDKRLKALNELTESQYIPGVAVGPDGGAFGIQHDRKGLRLRAELQTLIDRQTSIRASAARLGGVCLECQTADELIAALASNPHPLKPAESTVRAWAAAQEQKAVSAWAYRHSRTSTGVPPYDLNFCLKWNADGAITAESSVTCRPAFVNPADPAVIRAHALAVTGRS